MTIIVSGRTFDQRDLIKSIPGAEWNGVERYWTIPDTTSEKWLARLRAVPGIGVTRVGGNPYAEKPKPAQTGVAALVDAILSDKPVSGSSPGKIVGDDPTYFNAFRSKNPKVFGGFSSLSEFVRYVERLPEQSGSRGSGWSTHKPGWCGTRTMSDAIDLALRGWDRGTNIASEVAEALRGEAPEVIRKRPHIAGGRVNVGRMLSGSPVHMMHRKKQQGVKVVTLFVETSISADIEARYMIVYAGMIGAICDVLEMNDYSCEIVALDTTRWMDGPSHQLAVTLKRAGEPMNVSDVVFGLGHPSFQRRLVFAACSVPELREIWATMGMADKPFDSRHPPEPGSFYLPALTQRVQNVMERHEYEIDQARAAFPLIVPNEFPISLAD